jgi:integrase/recombinase XerD
MVRTFAKYYQADDQKTQIPPTHLLSIQPRRAQPYIYSDEQIRQLLTGCQSIIIISWTARTYVLYFFGLMAVTGCRISELVSLNQEDFNETQYWITILNSKFNKSRLLPLHQTTIVQLKKYIQIRDQYHTNPQSKAFFLSDRGIRLTVWSVCHAFIQISKQIGLRALSDSFGPRIHDIRYPNLNKIQTFFKDT